MSRHQDTVLRGSSLPEPLAARRFEHATAPAGVKGGFRVSLSDGTWWWSPGMYTVLGMPAAQVDHIPASTRLLFTHVHPADRRAVVEAWQHLLAGGGLVAFGCRVVGLDGVVRPVFVTASTDRPAPRASVISGVVHLEPAPRG